MTNDREPTKPQITIAMAYALAYAEAVKRTNENRAATNLTVRVPARTTSTPEAS